MMFQGDDGIWRPASAVRRAYVNRADHYEVEMTSGELVVVDERTYLDFQLLPLFTLVAAPGMFVVELNGDEVIKYPVIGWSVTAQNFTCAVTLSGIVSAAAVLMPDGSVHMSRETPWETLEDWVSYEKGLRAALGN